MKNYWERKAKTYWNTEHDWNTWEVKLKEGWTRWVMVIEDWHRGVSSIRPECVRKGHRGRFEADDWDGRPRWQIEDSRLESLTSEEI